jgi:hypothetical protein
MWRQNNRPGLAYCTNSFAGSPAKTLKASASKTVGLPDLSAVRSKWQDITIPTGKCSNSNRPPCIFQQAGNDKAITAIVARPTQNQTRVRLPAFRDFRENGPAPASINWSAGIPPAIAVLSALVICSTVSRQFFIINDSIQVSFDRDLI